MPDRLRKLSQVTTVTVLIFFKYDRFELVYFLLGYINWAGGFLEVMRVASNLECSIRCRE